MLYAKRFAAAVLLCYAALAAHGLARAQEGGPHAIDIPPWFKVTFLEFPDDVKEATAQGKRLMIYFGQDGCPYCKELMQVNFSQKDIVEKTRRHFDAIALNIWGDRPVVWMDGKTRSEKDLAAFLRVQYTPTLLFLDEQGQVVARVNGYYPPHRLRAALDYVSQKMERKMAFGEYVAKASGPPASGVLHSQPFFMKPPLLLQRDKIPASKPLAVFFEQKQCAACDELHAGALKLPQNLELLKRFDVARVNLHGSDPVLTPDGKRLAETQWAAALQVGYAPSVVFFDERGQEVFRVEAYLKSFHLQSALEYVASKAYREQPNFQRFIQVRAERLREQGATVDIWK